MVLALDQTGSPSTWGLEWHYLCSCSRWLWCPGHLPQPTCDLSCGWRHSFQARPQLPTWSSSALLNLLLRAWISSKPRTQRSSHHTGFPPLGEGDVPASHFFRTILLPSSSEGPQHDGFPVVPSNQLSNMLFNVLKTHYIACFKWVDFMVFT